MTVWNTEKLAKLTTKVGSGSTPRGGKDAYHESGIPLIRSLNVHFDGFRYDGLAYLDDEQAHALRAVEVRGGDVLLNITGASIGRVTVAPAAMDGARVNQHVCIIRPVEELDPSFLRWYLASPQTQDFILNVQSGATRQALTKEKILDFDIPFPPLGQQIRVVAEIEKQFSRLDEAVANLKRVKANLKRYKAAVLKAAVEGRLDFVGRVSQGAGEWKAVRLADIGELISGQSPPSNTVNTEAIGTLYITGPEQWDGRKLHLGKWTTSPKKIVPDGCFFITVKGAGVGKVFPGTACAIGRDIYAFKPSESVSKKFVMHALIASVQDVLRHASGDIPGLSRSHILDHEILLPRRVEQDRLVEELERRNSYANDLESVTDRSLQRAEHLRQSILAKMFGGGPVRGDFTKDRTIRSPSMEKRKLPGLPPARKSEAEDHRVDLESVLRKYPNGISAELLFQEAGYQGDQVDVFYRDLARLVDRVDQILPEHTETEWPLSGAVKVRLKA